jgi:hypothetical protein
MPSNQQLTSPGSITAPRTPRDRLSGRPAQYLNIQDPTSRPIGATFLIKSPVLPPGEKRQENWSKEIEKEWDTRVNNNSTRFIMTAEKRKRDLITSGTCLILMPLYVVTLRQREPLMVIHVQLHVKALRSRTIRYIGRLSTTRGVRNNVTPDTLFVTPISFEILCSGHEGLLHACKSLSPSLFLY